VYTRLSRTILLTLALLTGLAAGAQANSGVVVGISQPARIKSGDELKTLAMGAEVFEGDVVATGDAGEVQLLFPDETRIVVGPNSQLSVSKLLFRRNDTARKVSLNAVAGTFRMISGNSPKRAYSVRTPTAMMTVRGTAFDFAVERQQQDTTLVVHDGIVRFCGGVGRCVQVPRGCQTVVIDRLRHFDQPEDQAERLAILRQLFPSAEDDSRLEPLFRTFVSACRDDGGPGTTTAVRQLQLPPDPRNATLKAILADAADRRSS